MKKFLSAFFLFSIPLLAGHPTPVCAEPSDYSKWANVSDAKIHNLEILHEKAEEHILTNDFKGAIKIYEDIILEEPDDETAYTGLGQCYLVLGDYPRARNAYKNALHINPGNETALAGWKKIQDPDAIDYTEESPMKAPAVEAPQKTAPDEVVLPAPLPAEIPIRYEKAASPPAPAKAAAEDDIHLGAKKTMAPYSADPPPTIRDLTHEQWVQEALKNAGFYDGPIDGVLGLDTRKSIRAFQKKYDITVDGKVGPKTWELLQPFINKNDFEEKSLKNSASS